MKKKWEKFKELTAAQLVPARNASWPGLTAVTPVEPMARAALLMVVHGLAVLPVLDGMMPIGTVDESRVLRCLASGSVGLDRPIGEYMGPAPRIFPPATKARELLAFLGSGDSAVAVADSRGLLGLVTASGLLRRYAGAEAEEFSI